MTTYPAPPVPTLSPLQQLAVARGLSLETILAPPETQENGGKLPEVPHGPELKRVLSIARRPNPADTKESELIAAFLTERMTKGQNPYPGALRALQGASLQEIWLTRTGAVLPVPVGYGKTLIAYLSATILDAKRPLYLAPKGLLKQAQQEFRKYYYGFTDPLTGIKYGGWHGVHPDTWTFQSYETLSREGAGVQVDENRKVVRRAWLDRLDPDLVVCDEVHKLRNKSTSLVKKFADFKKTHPATPILALTGTLGYEVNHFSHLLLWCLGKGNCPVPTDWTERMAWHSATSSKPSFGPPTEVGALSELFNDDEKQRAAGADEDELKKLARVAIGRRVRETRGVVGIEGGELDLALSINAVEPQYQDPAIDELLLAVRSRGMIGEEVIPDAASMAVKTAMIGRGYYTEWSDPKPPKSWLEARKLWHSSCRDKIEHNRLGMYSEEAIKRAVRKGVFPDLVEILVNWVRERDAYRKETGLSEPIVREIVVSDEPLKFAVDWAKTHPASIVWAWHRGFGQRLADALGTSCYQEEGLCTKTGRYIDTHPHDTPMVASIPANGTGKNLQHGWHQNLWYGPIGEQSIGRTHRSGQKRAVTNDVYVATIEHARGFWAAHAKAQEAFEMTGAAQRLLYAVNSVPSLEHYEGRKGVRWQK